MTLEERIKVLEDRVAMLEQSQFLPYVPQPLYPWHGIYPPPNTTGDWQPKLPATWCCARNTHHDGEPSE